MSLRTQNIVMGLLTAFLLFMASLMLLSMLVKPVKAEDAKPAIPGISLAGCYAEASAIVRTKQEPQTGNLIEQNSIGGGCTQEMKGIMIGGGVRLDMGSGTRQGELYGTAGVALNTTGTYGYGLVAYEFDAGGGFKPMAINKGGVLILGGGLEQKIFSNVSIFGEGGKDFMQIGQARNLDPLWVARAGVRVRF